MSNSQNCTTNAKTKNIEERNFNTPNQASTTHQNSNIERVRKYFPKIYKINLRGIDIAYRILPSTLGYNTKALVFLLHGYLDHSGTFNDLLAHLPSDYTYIAPDFRGHGDSDQNPRTVSTYSIHDFIVDSVLLIRHFQHNFNAITPDFSHAIYDTSMEPPLPESRSPRDSRKRKYRRIPSFVVGHSFGSIIATYLSSLNSLDIDGLIALDSISVYGVDDAIFCSEFSKSFDQIVEGGLNARSRRLYDSPHAAIEQALANHVSKNPKVARKLAVDMIKKIGGNYTWKMDPRLSFKHRFFLVPQSVNEHVLSQIQCPYYFVGARGGMASSRSRLQLALDFARQKLGSASRVCIALHRGGHHLHMEEERVASVGNLMTDFLLDMLSCWNESDVKRENVFKNRVRIFDFSGVQQENSLASLHSCSADISHVKYFPWSDQKEDSDKCRSNKARQTAAVSFLHKQPRLKFQKSQLESFSKL